MRSGRQAQFAIDSGELLAGTLPRAQTRLVQAWIEIHQDELSAAWQMAVNGLTAGRRLTAQATAGSDTMNLAGGASPTAFARRAAVRVDSEACVSVPARPFFLAFASRLRWTASQVLRCVGSGRSRKPVIIEVSKPLVPAHKKQNLHRTDAEKVFVFVFLRERRVPPGAWDDQDCRECKRVENGLVA